MYHRVLTVLIALALSACPSTSSTGPDGASSRDGSAVPLTDAGGYDAGGYDAGGYDAGGYDAGGYDAALMNCDPSAVLHQDAVGDLFCYRDSGLKPLSCQTGQQCCLGGPIGGGNYAPNECSTWTASGSGCTNPSVGSIGIACYQIADCSANDVKGDTIACCLQGATTPKPAPGCALPPISAQGTAIVCESAGTGTGTPTAGTCAAGEVQICSSNADCPSGKTCVAGKWKVFKPGFCM